jgi:hypothetical protein
MQFAALRRPAGCAAFQNFSDGALGAQVCDLHKNDFCLGASVVTTFSFL